MSRAARAVNHPLPRDDRPDPLARPGPANPAHPRASDPRLREQPRGLPLAPHRPMLRSLALAFTAVLVCLAGCTPSVSTGAGGTAGSSTTSTTTSSGSGGGTCASTCAATGFCQYEYAACAPVHSPWISDDGTCTPRPDTCDDIYEPVCGCDGKAYPSACSANAAGVDIGRAACAPAVTPEGYIPCGPRYCDPKGSYCDLMQGDTQDTYWTCSPLPAACLNLATPDCACLGTPHNGSQCTVVQGNGASGLQDAWPAI